MKGRTALYTLMLCALFGSCSKNNDDSGSQETVNGYFPKTISLEYSTDNTAEYSLIYTTNHQIAQMVIDRTSGTDVVHIEVDFTYDENGNLTRVLSTSNNTENIMTFGYGAQNVVADIGYTIDGVEREVAISQGDNPNEYLVEGDLGNLPTHFSFDEQSRLAQFAIHTTSFSLYHSDFGKGIFHDVDVPPALHIWYTLSFYLAPWELYFLSQSDMDFIQQDNGMDIPLKFFYRNKLWDGNGNLVAFRLRPGIITINGNNVIFECNVTYESATF